jgi:hypothetical protein
MQPDLPHDDGTSREPGGAEAARPGSPDLAQESAGLGSADSGWLAVPESRLSPWRPPGDPWEARDPLSVPIVAQAPDGPGASEPLGMPGRLSRRPHTAPRPRRRRPLLAVTALLLGLAGTGISAAGIAGQLAPRSFTPAQRQQITSWEIARRWRTMPAGRIFPAAVAYQIPGSVLASSRQLALVARRAGIAPEARCSAATDPAAGRLLVRHGCAAVLRATYVDATQSLVITVGVAVMPSDAATEAVARDLSRGGQLHPGVRPARFRGTLAARFSAGQRQLSWASASGPYLILSTVGFADGRPREQISTDSYADAEMQDAASGVVSAVSAPLKAPPPPPRCPGAPGC